MNNYFVRVTLHKPCNRDVGFITGPINSNDIKNGFDRAIQEFHSMKVRKRDKGKIMNVVIRNHEIFFQLSFKTGIDKHIGKTIGNTISKYLFYEEGWNRLVYNSDNATSNNLFKVESHLQ